MSNYTPAVGDSFWRYEDRLYASSSYDEFGEPYGPPTVKVELRRFEVFKVTPKGVWIYPFGYGRLIESTHRFVLLSAHKKFACPTQRGAWESFKARKERQISIYKARIRQAESALRQVSATSLA